MDDSNKIEVDFNEMSYELQLEKIRYKLSKMMPGQHLRVITSTTKTERYLNINHKQTGNNYLGGFYCDGKYYYTIVKKMTNRGEKG